MQTVTLELPEDVFTALRLAPRDFTKEMRFAAAVHWYHHSQISGSRAGEVAGMTRLEFLDELARRRLDTIVVDVDDLKRELADA